MKHGSHYKGALIDFNKALHPLHSTMRMVSTKKEKSNCMNSKRIYTNSINIYSTNEINRSMFSILDNGIWRMFCNAKYVCRAFIKRPVNWCTLVTLQILLAL